jgi:hypothetical protein
LSIFPAIKGFAKNRKASHVTIASPVADEKNGSEISLLVYR